MSYSTLQSLANGYTIRSGLDGVERSRRRLTKLTEIQLKVDQIIPLRTAIKLKKEMEIQKKKKCFKFKVEGDSNARPGFGRPPNRTQGGEITAEKPNFFIRIKS